MHRLVIGDIGKCRGRESDHHCSDYGPKFRACYSPSESEMQGVWRETLTMGKCACCRTGCEDLAHIKRSTVIQCRPMVGTRATVIEDAVVMGMERVAPKTQN